MEKLTAKEEDNFYGLDKKKYIIAKNRELLDWLNEIINEGYVPILDIKQLQNLIDTIVYWYEMKYPEREMYFYDTSRDLKVGFKDTKPMSKSMTLDQLLFRLSDNQLDLMKCNYRTGGHSTRLVYDNQEVIGYKDTMYLRITRKKHFYNPEVINRFSNFLVFADADDGRVRIDFNLSEYTKENITLDELLVLFKEKYIEELDFYKLEECIFVHKCDIELRNKILQLVALKLLYSKNTVPQRGYERAKRFINEINKKLGLELSSEEIDEIMFGGVKYNPNSFYTDDSFSHVDIDCVAKTNEDINESNRKIKYDSRLYIDGVPVGDDLGYLLRRAGDWFGQIKYEIRSRRKK